MDTVASGPSWSWSRGIWIYNYLCNHYLSTITMWVWILFRRGVLDTTLCDKKFVSDLQPIGCFPVSSINTTYFKYLRRKHQIHRFDIKHYIGASMFFKILWNQICITKHFELKYHVGSYIEKSLYMVHWSDIFDFYRKRRTESVM